MRNPTILLLALLGAASTSAVPAQEAAEDELLTCGYLCGEDGMPLMTETETAPDTELVTRIFIGAFSEPCAWAIAGGPGMAGPDVYNLSYRPVWSEADEPDLELKLYRFFCGSGAYNERHVYYTWTSDLGVRPVSFAEPTYSVAYAGDEAATGKVDIDSALETLTVTGMSARHELVNSSFDEATATITDWSCWRGLCDASSRGQWVLDGDSGEFRLVTYDIDPTYDGEVNLFRVADFGQPRPVDISSPLPFDPPALEDEQD